MKLRPWKYGDIIFSERWRLLCKETIFFLCENEQETFKVASSGALFKHFASMFKVVNRKLKFDSHWFVICDYNCDKDCDCDLILWLCWGWPLIVHAHMSSWSQIQSQLRHPNNPVVFFDINIGTTEAGRIKFELFADVVPKTAENFR